MGNQLYNKLSERKNSGEKLVWDEITREELEDLFEDIPDSMIAELYGVSKADVTKKRKKWNITMNNCIIKKVVEKFPDYDFSKVSNNTSKAIMLSEDNIDNLSIALTHYLFRNGPVEDMHSEGKLSQEDMKTLNKFMVNRIAGLLETINKNEWGKLEKLFIFYSLYGKDWDKPVPDTEEIDFLN